MSAPNWTPRFRGMLQTLSPELVEELDGLAAFLKGQFANISTQYQTIIESEQGLEDHTTVPPNTPNTPDQPSQEDGIRWLKGPWLFGPDGNVKAFSAIRPPDISSTRHNYAPEGIDNTVILELQSTTAVSITGIKRKMQQRRILGIFNRGGFTISLVNQSTSSQTYNRFDWGTTGDAGDTIGIPTGQMVWLFYDVVSERWRLFAIPAVGADNLPTSLVPTPDPFVFPPRYGWWQSRITDSSNTIRVVFQGAPSFLAASGTNYVDQYGFGVTRETGTAVGNMEGVQAASGDEVRSSFDPTWDVWIRTGSVITSVRYWIVLSDTAVASSDDIGGGGAADGMGFRYSTDAGDGGWVGVCRDGTTQSVTSTVASIAASTDYRLRVRKSGSSVFFSVNGGTEVEHTTNLPQTSAALRWRVTVETRDGGGGAGAIRRLTFRGEWCKFGFEPS